MHLFGMEDSEGRLSMISVDDCLFELRGAFGGTVCSVYSKKQ